MSKLTVTIKVSGAHSNTSKRGTRELIEEFLGEAGIFGEITALLGRADLGRPQHKGLAGVRVMRQCGDNGVEIVVQPGSNDSRRFFTVLAPPGLSAEKLFALLSKAQERIATKKAMPRRAAANEAADDADEAAAEMIEDEGTAAAEEIAPAATSCPPTEADRILEAYLAKSGEVDRMRAQAAATIRQVAPLQGELRDIERRATADADEQSAVGRRIAEIESAIARLGKELFETRERFQEFDRASARHQADAARVNEAIEAVRVQTAAEAAEADRLAAEAEDLRRAHAAEESKAKAIEAAASAAAAAGISLEDLAAALAAMVKNPT